MSYLQRVQDGENVVENDDILMYSKNTGDPRYAQENDHHEHIPHACPAK